MTPPLRVTVVNSAGVIGGAELWLLSLLDATDRLEADVVMLGDGPLREQLARRGLPFVTHPTGPSGADVAAAAAWLARRLRADRPDVVLANGVKAAVVTAPAAWLAGVRCVWAKHDHTFDGLLMRMLALVTDVCIGTEPGLVTASQHPRAVFVPVPAPGDALPREAARDELVRRGVRLDRDELLLLMVGRLVSYKGVDDAIRALAKPGGERWRLGVVGPADPNEPGERERLAALATELGVADRVDFTGWVEDAWRVVPAADAIAMLTKPGGSGPGQEAFGGAANEGMLCGVAVITTGPGSVADRVAGPAAGPPAGITVPPADPAAVTAALRRLADPDTRAAMGRAGVHRTASDPGPETCADLLARTLSEAACLPGAGLTGTTPVSVVTTVLNESAVIDRLLDLLVPQLTVDGDEIIVVDAGSTDGTDRRVRAWAAKDDRVRLALLPGAGISAGRNAGVRAALNSLIACTDAGCYPAGDWLARLRAAAAESVPAGLLTGVYRVDGRGVLAQGMAAVGYPVPEEARHPGPWTRLYCRLFGRGFDATMPTGRSMAFFRAAWQDAGGFPEHLQTSEDVLFGRDVVAAGHRAALVASAEVGWEQRPTLRQAARMYFRYGEGSGWSADARLLGRDLARAFAYTIGAAAVMKAPRARPIVASVYAAYLSLPLTRAIRGHHWAALPTIFVLAAVRDLAKAAGAVHALACRVRSGGASVHDRDSDGA